MKRYRLIWFNPLSNSDETALILGRNEEDAHEIAIIYIESRIGKRYKPGSCLTELYEESNELIVTREDVE